jgi:hypothetical protein
MSKLDKFIQGVYVRNRGLFTQESELISEVSAGEMATTILADVGG